MIKGANIENASYGGTICAERTALVKAVVSASEVYSQDVSDRLNLTKSEGTTSFTALAVVTYVFFASFLQSCAHAIYLRIISSILVNRDVASALSPCGMCRQFIREFCAQTMPIYLVPANYHEKVKSGDVNGGILETSIGELLPHSFGPEELDLPRTGQN